MKATHSVLALAICALTACDTTLRGTLVVSDAFDVEAAQLFGRKKTQISPGTYVAVAETGPATTLFTLSSPGGKKIAFRTKSLLSLREKLQNDHARITAAELTQPFDIDLTVKTEVLRESDYYNKSERCVLGYHDEPYQIWHPEQTICRSYEERCYQKPGTNGDERSDFDCRTECAYWDRTPGYYEHGVRTVTDYGIQYTQGYDRTTQRKADIKLIQNHMVVATMDDAGEKPETVFITTQVSGCQ